MSLSEEVMERVADVVFLQPTKNSVLQDRWDIETGSEVHRYLEAELSEYYYRDENSLICATPKAVQLVDAGQDQNQDSASIQTVSLPELEAQVFEVLPGADARSGSVVSVLHALRDDFDIDPDLKQVRSVLRSLQNKGVAEVVQRTVPTFRLAIERDSIVVEITGGVRAEHEAGLGDTVSVVDQETIFGEIVASFDSIDAREQ